MHPDTAIDKEAAHRSTSTYLVERRLDMLPGLLTTDICSLRGHEDHLTFSVLWEMDSDGQILSVDFCKSVIHSAASLTYDQAQVMLDDSSLSVEEILARPLPVSSATSKGRDHSDDAVRCSVKLLNHIAHILRDRRIEAGALTLASPEVRFKLDRYLLASQFYVFSVF